MKRTHLDVDGQESSTAKIDKKLEAEKSPLTKKPHNTPEKQSNTNQLNPKMVNPIPNPLLPSAYNHRDVLGLKPLTEWTEKEIQIHKKYNRILQPGFMQRNADDVLNDAKLAGVNWLTDYCCPTIQSAILLHIAKELVVHYKIKDDDLNNKAHEIYNSLLKNDAIISDLNIKINIIMQEATKPTGPLNQQVLMQKAIIMLKENKITDPTPQQLQSAIRLILDKERRIKADELVSELIKKYLLNKHFNLDPKTKYDLGKSNDFCFLGAAGSGKSTISKGYLTDEQKTDYVTLATDNYRIFTMPDTQAHEEKETKDVFTKTQDMAFLVKELVLNEIELQIKNEKKRANIICDCIRLEPAMRNLLAQGTVTSVVAAFKGSSGFSEIAERADRRARDVTASPADKGRFVQTTELLKGHADASRKLLENIPDQVTTIIYDTHVEMNTSPKEIAKINRKTNIIEISNLKVMAEFLNKQNINIEAVNQIDLIYPKNNALNILATHPENKAKAVLDLALFSQNNKSYTINLMNDNACYAEVALIDKQLSLKILDHGIFMNKAQSETIEGSVLRAMTRQIEMGDIKKSVDTAFAKGDKTSFMALNLIENRNTQTPSTTMKL